MSAGVHNLVIEKGVPWYKDVQLLQPSEGDPEVMEPIDLTGKTIVAKMARTVNSVPTEITATITDDEEGRVRFSLTKENLDDVDWRDGQWDAKIDGSLKFLAGSVRVVPEV